MKRITLPGIVSLWTKMIHRFLISLYFLICTVTFALGQENDFISRLKTQLLLYRTQKVDQMIVIQTDKTLYRPGETIWMKGYVTDALTHALSLKSLELAVQLVDNKGVYIMDVKNILKNGVVDCSFTIPVNLPAGIYDLVAFTPEIEVIGLQSVFRKELTIARPEHLDIVPHLDYPKLYFTPERKETATIQFRDFDGKPISGKKFDYQMICEDRELLSGKGKTGVNGKGEFVFITPSPKSGSALFVSLDISLGNDKLNLIDHVPLESEKINVDFFPDGGKLVTGIPQAVVFEAKDQLGNPVNINAEIIDEERRFVAPTTMIYPGVGVFSLVNVEGRKLFLRIIGDAGKNQESQLPSPSSGNMSLTVKKNDGKNISLLLGRSPKSELAKFVIVAVANGELVWASDFELEQGGALNVPLDQFHSEFASVAVFSETGKLVAQRLIYTGKSSSLNVNLSPDKKSYKKGEDGVVRVKITGSDGRPVKAELAVSLADRYTFPSSSSEVGFLNYGLEKPFPFKESLDKVNDMSMNYYLATNSLRGFDWNRVVMVDPDKPLSHSMGEMRISGKVFDASNLPVPNALVSLTSASLQQFKARSDQHGEFVVGLPVTVEKNNLSASATDGFGKGNYRVVLNKSFKDELVNRLRNISVNNWEIFDQLFASNYLKENPDFFRSNPSAKAKMGDKRSSEPYWKRNLENSTDLLEIIKMIRPYELIGGKIVFRGANSFIAQDGALVVVDGTKLGTDASLISSINPNDVEDIQILLNPEEISKYTAL